MQGLCATAPLSKFGIKIIDFARNICRWSKPVYSAMTTITPHRDIITNPCLADGEKDNPDIFSHIGGTGI